MWVYLEYKPTLSEISTVGSASACQAEGREFKSHISLNVTKFQNFRIMIKILSL